MMTRYGSRSPFWPPPSCDDGARERFGGVAGGARAGDRRGGVRRGARPRAAPLVLRGLRLGRRTGELGGLCAGPGRCAAPPAAARPRRRGARRHPEPCDRAARRPLGRLADRRRHPRGVVRLACRAHRLNRGERGLMDLGLEGRVALVTGGSKGIGLGIARALAAEGATVAVAARNRDAVDAAAEEGGGRGFAFDSDDLDAIPGLLEDVEAALGPIDVYIANTGGPPPNRDPLGFTRDQWESAHRTLVLSPMTILQRLLPGMRERGWGRVVLVASGAVREPIAALQLSNAHRPGMVVAFKVLARDAARDGVTLNTLLPGRIATERILGPGGSREEADAAARDTIPAGRLGEPEDMGAAAAFLCSQPAGYITGTTLLVDGGLTVSVS